MVNYYYSKHGNQDDYQERPRQGERSIYKQLLRRDRLHEIEWIANSSHRFNPPPGKVKVHLARAKHYGSWTPGYLDLAQQKCIIVWGGEMHKKEHYQILLTEGNFVPCTDTRALLRATPAGVSENGEPLYIGRVKHGRKYLYGKVQRSHGVCYVPIHGKEKAFEEYFVFVRSKPHPEVTNLAALTKRENGWLVVYDDDEIPRNAVIAVLVDGSPMYIGRARHRGSITPGFVTSDTRMCHIVWGGKEWEKQEFEILCGANGSFVPTERDVIPANALPAGESENGETLYIGRVQHGANVLVGKVQPSHRVCYVSIDEQEVGFTNYEIYSSQAL